MLLNGSSVGNPLFRRVNGVSAENLGSAASADGGRKHHGFPSQPDGCISGKNDDCGGDESLQMRFFPRFGKMSLYSNPDPPVSEPRFGTIFGSDRYWGGSTAADLGMMAAEKSIDEGSFPQTEQRNSSAVMRARVMEARARQEKRFADESISYNSQMTRRQIEEYCRLSGEDAVFFGKGRTAAGNQCQGTRKRF